MSYLVKLSSSPAPPADSDVYLVHPHSPSVKRSGSMLDRAIAEADGVIQAAHADADALRRQAQDQGYLDGLQRAAEQWSAAVGEVERLRQAINEERETFLASAESQVVKLCVDIAEKILRHELETSPEKVLEIVKFSLLQLTDRDTIQLRVNPEDAELIKEHREVIKESAGGIRQIEIIEDRRVDRGGCIAVSASGSLDGRIKSQLTEIKRALTEGSGDDDRDTGPGSEQILNDS